MIRPFFSVLLYLIGSALLAASSPNALIREESPYLKQHAYNPVHWMPWSTETLQKAREENRPIFLSIGYSTCHWCHVMKEESFEDPHVAKLLNEHFIPIKVDREEMPQLDRYFQKVHRLLTRRAGGWPLTILLTPEGDPFYAATYLPKKTRYQRIGLVQLLDTVARKWKRTPDEILQAAKKVREGMQKFQRWEKEQRRGWIDKELSQRLVEELSRTFDRQYGGWGREPKFPRAMSLIALMKIYQLTGKKRPLEMATQTLDTMARGGIYDLIDGGFFRYSTDRRWRIPHFEKMLYTNAELIEAYALAFQITGVERYAEVVRRSVELWKRRFRDSKGLFYGASDADSTNPATGKKEEGYYYTFNYASTVEELEKAGVIHPKEAVKKYGITSKEALISGGCLPHLERGMQGDAALEKILHRIRDKRPYPFVDIKMLSSWNALLVHGLFAAERIDPEYRKLALKTLKEIYRQLMRGGRLYHQKVPGSPPKREALFEDYSFLIMATLDAYDRTGEPLWLQRALFLENQARRRFYTRGVWYDDRENAQIRTPLEISGGAYRAPLGVMADNELRLALYTGSSEALERGESILRNHGGTLMNSPQTAPMGVLTWLADQCGYLLYKIPRWDFGRLRRWIEGKSGYPFILFQRSDKSLYQVCGMDRCYLGTREKKEFLRQGLELHCPRQ